MAKKKTINVITAVSDPILGTTYKSQPVATIPEDIVHAQKQYKKFKTQQTHKVRGERTKNK